MWRAYVAFMAGRLAIGQTTLVTNGFPKSGKR
jgi:hypothetical protein